MTQPVHLTTPRQRRREELMEELYTLIYHTDLDGFERIERAITRILKAVADGELDEALGMVGRGTIKYPKTSADLDEHSEIWDGELVIWDGPHQVPSPYRFIALSPFPREPLGTGTGKEEEPSFIAEIH